MRLMRPLCVSWKVPVVSSPRLPSMGRTGSTPIPCASLLPSAPRSNPSSLCAKKKSDVLDEAARAVVNGKLGDLNAFMDSFVQRRRAAQKAVLELTDQIKIIEQEALVLQNSSKGETNAIATLTLHVDRESSVELQLAYGEYRYHPNCTALDCDSWFSI